MTRRLVTLSIEATVVGIILVIMGNIIGLLISKSPLSVPLPDACKKWNDFYAMEASLFLAGVLTHLVFELIGANKWYCKHGNACSKN